MGRRVRLWLPLGVAMALVGGCGGGSAKPDGGAGGASGANGDGFAIGDGASVLVPAVTRVVFNSTGGGYSMPPPAGAACRGGIWTYTLDVVAGAFTWSICDVSGTGSNVSDYVPNMGMRTLPATQLDTARAAIADVHVSANRRCAADKDYWTLEVASTAASLTYGDDFYGCSTKYEHFVASADLYALQRLLVILAH